MLCYPQDRNIFVPNSYALVAVMQCCRGGEPRGGGGGSAPFLNYGLNLGGGVNPTQLTAYEV